jgi:hypothetical protein
VLETDEEYMDRAASPDGAIDLEGRFEIKKTAGSDLGLD